MDGAAAAGRRRQRDGALDGGEGGAVAALLRGDGGGDVGFRREELVGGPLRREDLRHLLRRAARLLLHPLRPLHHLLPLRQEVRTWEPSPAIAGDGGEVSLTRRRGVCLCCRIMEEEEGRACPICRRLIHKVRTLRHL